MSSEIENEENVEDEGFTLLSKHSEENAPVADLVFIHGIQGHPKKTWTHPKTTKSNPKGVYWPRDLLSDDFPNLRVLTYGYDSHVTRYFAATNQKGISAHAESFLRALARERLDAPKRPLIFLAHSLGGIITEEALFKAQQSSKEIENDVLFSTHAVIFFGTPHGGSPWAHRGQLLESAAKFIFPTNPNILRDLGTDGETLERIKVNFVHILDKHKLRVYSFREAKNFSGIKMFSRKVAETSSSTLAHVKEETDSIDANHTMMCKFGWKTDRGYVKVKGVIRECLQDIERSISLDDEKLLEICLLSLYSPVMSERLEYIDPAEPHTFEWIFTEKTVIIKDAQNATFTEWLTCDGSLLWIKGKPAAGKSTLLKYLYEHENTLEILKSRWTANVAVASFFFYDRANNPQFRSLDGLLRSLLYELLRSVPQFFKFISEIFQVMRKAPKVVWRRRELEKAIIAIGKQQDVTGCICLFMDALDEYPGDCKEVVQNMECLLGYFAHSTYKLKICASSRPLNQLETKLSRYPQIAIHDWTLGDITIKVTNWLQEADKGRMPFLQNQIISKAKGSFKWVELVLKTLEPPLYDFESEEQLLHRLSLLPNNLDPFYEHLLQKIPQAIRPKMWMVLQLMFCNANRGAPLTLAEISLAVKLPEEDGYWLEPLSLSAADDHERCKQLRMSLETYLGAFVELRKWKPNGLRHEVPKRIYSTLTDAEYELTISSLCFSHRTARDFILSPTASKAFDSDVAVDYGLAGHIRLCKMYTLLAGAPSAMFYLVDSSSLDYIRRDFKTEFILRGFKTEINPFETNLMVFWGIHEREVEYLEQASLSGQVPDFHDIRDIQLLLDKNEYMCNKFALWPQAPYRRAVENLSLKYALDPIRKKRVYDFNTTVCASMGMDWVQKWAEQCTIDNFENEWPIPQSFLAFALLNGLYLYARDFLESDSAYQLNDQNPPLLFWTIASCKFIDRTAALDLWRDEAERCEVFALYLLKKGANPNAVFRIAFQQESPDEPEALERALQHGHAEITLLHYALGVIISVTDKSSSVLRMAMLELICILVENGATVGDTLYTNYWKQRGEPLRRTILHYLTFPISKRKEHENGYIEEFDPFKLPDEGQLLDRTIKTLLDHGADPNARDSDGMDVLTSFMLSCPRDLVEYALEKGALISPLLLREDGSPVGKYGILHEDRWRRPECYTPEAREIVRKHMPHWKEAVMEQPIEGVRERNES